MSIENLEREREKVTCFLTNVLKLSTNLLLIFEYNRKTTLILQLTISTTVRFDSTTILFTHIISYLFPFHFTSINQVVKETKREKNQLKQLKNWALKH